MQFASWDQVSTSGETNDLLQNLSYWHLFFIEEKEHRERIAGYINSGDFYSLCNYDLSYEGVTPESAYHIRQCLAYYSKRVDLDLGIDREKVAFDTFVESEALCAETNAIFKAWGHGKFQFSPCVESVLHGAQRIIASCLGDVPKLSDLRFRFGPGATTQIKKESASSRSKLGQTLCCSEDLLPYVADVLEEMPAWTLAADPDFVGPLPKPNHWEPEGYWGEECESEEEWLYLYGNGREPEPYSWRDTVTVSVQVSPGKLSFVPKNAKTDRGIVVEPMLNSMCQLGVGEVIRQRLLAIGVDIRDQSLNQRLAREGSLTGELATLDLSSASDNIAIELVAHLLPIDWFDLLSKFRTGYVTYGKQRRVFKLQKFSSMGNGFTFPLETLIFYALAKASADALFKKDAYKVNVYGDDIIVPSLAFRLVTEVLHAVGFQTNAKKSFSSGPFRESCGADYLSGTNIRPCYIKGPLSCADLFVLHNYYVRAGAPEQAEDIARYIPKDIQLWGPDGYGDGHLISDAPLTPYRRDRGWSGYIFETYVHSSRVSFEVFSKDYVFPSYCIYCNPAQKGFDGLEASVFTRLHQRAGRGHTRVEGFYSSAPSVVKYEKLSRDDKRAGIVPKLGVTLPGTEGYKRVKVYTLNG